MLSSDKNKANNAKKWDEMFHDIKIDDNVEGSPMRAYGFVSP